MTSAELKHRVKLQEWAARIQDCRSSGLSVRAWCRQEEINAATYYRWERELLALAETEPCSSVSAVRFAELPAPKRGSRNVAERSATLHIGNASLDIYPGCDTEQLKMLVELLRLPHQRLRETVHCTVRVPAHEESGTCGGFPERLLGLAARGWVPGLPQAS